MEVQHSCYMCPPNTRLTAEHDTLLQSEPSHGPLTGLFLLKIKVSYPAFHYKVEGAK